MPDALTHYASSHLASRAALKPKRAALAALAGPLPDLDALRAQAGHPQPGARARGRGPGPAGPHQAKSKHLRAATLTATLYALHITLDALTSLTPALWPLAPSIQKIEVNGRISQQRPALAASAAVATSPTDFTTKPSTEGPLVSETGLVLAAVTLILTAVEYITNWKRCGK
jgi:hypothetical protein